jgi:hypothetical protein
MTPAPSRHEGQKDQSRRRSKQFPPSPVSASSVSIAGRSKLRSASRTSKNKHHNPPQTDQERKNRDSHNHVEKQYRNRLNAQFESLLEALPEDMRATEEEEEGGGPVDNDRRVSKAEVLEMAKRYIKTLERECIHLKGEKNDMRDKMEGLRSLFGRCQGGDWVNQ